MAEFKGRIVDVGGPTGIASECDECGRWIWIVDGADLDAPEGELVCAKCAGRPETRRQQGVGDESD